MSKKHTIKIDLGQVRWKRLKVIAEAEGWPGDVVAVVTLAVDLLIKRESRLGGVERC